MSSRPGGFATAHLQRQTDLVLSQRRGGSTRTDEAVQLGFPDPAQGTFRVTVYADPSATSSPKVCRGSPVRDLNVIFESGQAGLIDVFERRQQPSRCS